MDNMINLITGLGQKEFTIEIYDDESKQKIDEKTMTYFEFGTYILSNDKIKKIKVYENVW